MRRSKRSDRFYEAKFEDETKVAILPGENPLKFERLHAKLAEEWAPDGLLEENAVLKIAKCMWRDRGYQQFILSKTTTNFSKAYSKEGEQKLLAFDNMLVEGAAEHEIRRELDRLEVSSEHFLLKHVPRQDFENTEAWAEAMSKVIKEVLLPSIVAILDEKAKAKILQSKPPDDELFDREIRFNERNEAALQRAIDRLLELKKAKRLVSFRAIQRFERTHPERLGGTTIVRQKSR